MSIQEDITRGMFAYRGIAVMQHPKIADAFKKLFEQTTPAQILEIGTASGGLTLILRDLLDQLNLKNSIFRTYDLHNENYINHIRPNDQSIEMITKNIFTRSYAELLNEEKDEVYNFIQRSGTTIVLCDGGSKVNEFNILSNFLKDGDVIMAHDYAPSLEVFIKDFRNKIWNWCEIDDSKIEESCIKNNLKPFLSEQFYQVAWLCKRKQI